MKYIAAIAALLFVSQLHAQTLKVSVRDAVEPLPFANIWLNGAYLMSADMEGVAEISEGALKPGDTISSSYLGYANAAAIYDETMRAARLCTLVHTKEQNYEIEPVAVTAGMDGWNAFQKFTDPKETPQGRYVLKGDFGARISMPDGAVRDVKGAFAISDVNYQRDLFSAPVTLSTTSDTTAVSRIITGGMSFAAQVARALVYRLLYVHSHTRERKNPYRTLNYLGLQDGKRDFTFTYVAPDIRGTNQALLKVDGESKFVESIHLVSTAEKLPDALINSATVDFEPYRKGGRGPVRALPTRIEVDFRPDDKGHKTDLTLSGVTIEIVK
jgi:hypothetical protein